MKNKTLQPIRNAFLKFIISNVVFLISITASAQVTSTSYGNQIDDYRPFGCRLFDAFTYDGNPMPHYGLKWYGDSKLPGGYAFALSGYMGIKLFTAGTMRIFVNIGGNVGIGTEDPAYKLDVNGTIRAKEIKVDLNGADFVFENDYKLMPLNELEKFIKEQKHLPEVSAAKEMKENGTDLGNLNSKLLQKIEELTLYTIEQNKKILVLEKRNEVIEELKQSICWQNKKIEKMEAASKFELNKQ